MVYSVKEIFKTLQGEGAHAGRPSVFCRFSGCNLWTGREADRANAVCQFCDTDFIGTDGQNGGKFANADELAKVIASFWHQDMSATALAEAGKPYVVFTGGEPLLQLDIELIAAVKMQGFEIAVETNGTLQPPPGIDWICMSPKAGAPLQLTSGNELKLVFPQPNLLPNGCLSLEFDHFWLQPMDGPKAKENTRLAVAYCLSHPKWRLSLQTHKFIGID